MFVLAAGLSAGCNNNSAPTKLPPNPKLSPNAPQDQPVDAKGKTEEWAIEGDSMDKMRAADAATFYAGEAFVSWQQLAQRMAEQMPEHYAGLSAEAVSAQARALGVASRDGRVRDTGKVLKGAKLTEVDQAIARQQLTGSVKP
jgi:hypothetical protein